VLEGVVCGLLLVPKSGVAIAVFTVTPVFETLDTFIFVREYRFTWVGVRFIFVLCNLGI
jgi:hypothetical protein